jgi:pimeloyl-ACP methyl ester carboxylesterase
MANQMAMVFSKLDCNPRWRERLSELAIPALVVHGRRDPFFPVGNGEALVKAARRCTPWRRSKMHPPLVRVESLCGCAVGVEASP